MKIKLLFLILIIFTSCSSDETEENENNENQQELEVSTIKMQFWGPSFEFDIHLPQLDGTISDENYVSPIDTYLVDNPIIVEREFYATGDTLRIELKNNSTYGYMKIEYNMPYVESTNSGVQTQSPITRSVPAGEKGYFKLSTNSLYRDFYTE